MRGNHGYYSDNTDSFEPVKSPSRAIGSGYYVRDLMQDPASELLRISWKLSEANLSRADLPSTDLSEAHLLGTDLSEAELMSANLDGANARVAARAGRVNPSAPAGHRLQLPVGELAAFAKR
jgi:hypothetical protein